MTAPMVDYKIHWLKMMSVPESRTVVGRHDGINGRDRPDQNDGVLITAATLWKLFRHRPWQRELEKCWKALESGEYDWAHLALAVWPERVRETCRNDKSIAIAHELEDLYEGD